MPDECEYRHQLSVGAFGLDVASVVEDFIRCYHGLIHISLALDAFYLGSN